MLVFEQAGHDVVWAVDGRWYLDGLNVNWDSMYEQEPTTGLSPAQAKHIVGGEGTIEA